uniref:uncharacterized protein LOC120326530 n=1 Tax=Styela clava TaxID=7725 RepID=UPI00193AC9A0|nr:uncharacterized protein LOC120326530 [Styela clava]
MLADEQLSQDEWADLITELQQRTRDEGRDSNVIHTVEDEQECDDIPDLHQTTSEITFVKNVFISKEEALPILRSLNEMQTEVFYAIRQWCVKKANGKNPDPFHLFISGGAGTGKSHLVKAIYYETSKVLANRAEDILKSDILTISLFRFWCVLQNSCLYCYNSPQSEFTQDVVVLRGYVVSADISDVQRAKFTFKLEQKGGSTYHFRCDNHQGFMQWICMINKESSDADPAMSDNEILMNNVKSCAKVLTRAQSSIYPSSPQMSPSMATQPPPNTLSKHNNKSMLSRRHTADNIFRMTRREHLDLELQKENLLREVLEQQKEIIKERNSMIPTPKQNRPYYVPLVRGANSPIPSRDEVMEKYEKVKENQQMEILKSLTQLHTRRNSVQLKIDQLSRETKPKARRSRSANRYVIQSMEARLALLQSELAEIDQEIREQHVNKEDLADNINQKRDLEIMVLDQQECIDIVKRSNPSQRRYQHRQERGRRATRRIMPSNTPISFAHDHLTSIDEASTICESDSSSTSSGLSNSCSDLDSQTSGIMAISSTPRHKITDTGSVESIDADYTSRIDCISSHDETECFRSCRSIPVSKSSSCSSDADEIMSVEGVLSDDFRSLSTSSYSDLDTDGMCRQRTSSSDESLGKKSNDIRPDVLAEIEEFEVFSKMMLQRLNSATC